MTSRLHDIASDNPAIIHRKVMTSNFNKEILIQIMAVFDP